MGKKDSVSKYQVSVLWLLVTASHRGGTDKEVESHFCCPYSLQMKWLLEDLKTLCLFSPLHFSLFPHRAEVTSRGLLQTTPPRAEMTSRGFKDSVPFLSPSFFSFSTFERQTLKSMTLKKQLFKWRKLALAQRQTQRRLDVYTSGWSLAHRHFTRIKNINKSNNKIQQTWGRGEYDF